MNVLPLHFLTRADPSCDGVGTHWQGRLALLSALRQASNADKGGGSSKPNVRADVG
jgi:hypothetical protein